MTGSDGDSGCETWFIDEGESAESMASSGGMMGSVAVGGSGGMPLLTRGSCVGAGDGVLIGPSAATIDGFGYWNSQSK